MKTVYRVPQKSYLGGKFKLLFTFDSNCLAASRNKAIKFNSFNKSKYIFNSNNLPFGIMGRDGELLLRYEPDKRKGFMYYGQSARDRLFARHVKIGNEDNVWKRFTILPNINGQKYTIGETFTSREEQGEFIFLFHEQETFPAKKKSVCEIIVDEERYFVTPLSRGSAVFLNDVKVVKKTELRFGDYLTLGDKSKSKKSFLFKERELNPEAFIYSNAAENSHSSLKSKRDNTLPVELEFTPGQNGLIVSHILSYLSVDEMKSTRFVSKLWNEEAFKILKKRCTVFFNFNVNYGDPNESMKLFRYFAEMGNNPVPNLKIEIPGISHLDDYTLYEMNSSPGKPGAKLLEDLNVFLFQNPKMQYLKRLQVEGLITTKSEYELRIKLFQAVGKQLEELDWGGGWSLNEAPGKDHQFQFPGNVQYPKLRIFTLSIYYCENEEDTFSDDGVVKNYSNLTWVQQLVKAIKGVTTIRLECPGSLSFPFLASLNESSRLFCNLMEINVSQINAAGIKLLLNLDKPLNELKLAEMEDLEKRDFQALGELLSKHAQTLKSLQFFIPPCLVEDGGPAFICFPTFPKLEKLNVGWSQEDYGKTGVVKLIFLDGSSFVNYERDLPSLKSLTLWPTNSDKYKLVDPYVTDSSQTYGLWKDTLPLYRMFFPTIARENRGEALEICKTVQVLDIFHSLPKRPELFPETSEAKIAAMFPNIQNNAWIDSIRERGSINNSKISKESKPKVEKKVDQPILGRLRSEARKLRSRLDPAGEEQILGQLQQKLT